MNRAEVIARLKTVEPQLRARGVGALYLYGSHARDEAEAGSDVDVFVDAVDDHAFGFLSSMDAYRILEGVFPGIEVGYSTRDGIVPCYRPYIEHNAVRIF